MVKLRDGKTVYDVKDIGTVSGAERNPNGIYLDCDSQAIPDLNKLSSDVISFLEYIGTEEMEQMQSKDNEAFTKHVQDKFPEFSLNYINIFNMLLEKENRDNNIMKLLNLFDVLKEVKSGRKDMNNEFERFKESQAQEYIYPQFGGKTNFEQKIKERASDKQKKGK
ncbi:hypothetical protein Catovirus_2_175 [Catovirus CTV1]|uniref:Uncharacterized protein n=1 Tax=Catovirus CTV1 TaxID=1977631 RepID=A0A1V0SBZ5_9VIRU|nr:hypothetical protein Catovirus_2_175 [Catovirus CTV1]